MCFRMLLCRKMFVVFFAFMLVTAHAVEKLPSYIHPCSPQDPNYDQCIADNINFMKNKICEGIPELDISPNEPLRIDKIIIYDTNNLKLQLKDLNISGICDFTIKSFHVEPEKFHYRFDVILHHLKVDTIYDVDINLLVSIANKGLAHISSDNILGTLTLDLKEVTKKGKKHIYGSGASLRLNIETFDFEFDDSEKQLVQLHEVLTNIVNENKQDIIDKFKPKVEEVISKLLIEVANNVTYNRYELLFPKMP